MKRAKALTARPAPPSKPKNKAEIAAGSGHHAKSDWADKAAEVALERINDSGEMWSFGDHRIIARALRFACARGFRLEQKNRSFWLCAEIERRVYEITRFKGKKKHVL